MLLPASLLVACIGIVWNFTRFGRWAPLGVTVALQGIWDLLYGPWQYNMIPTSPASHCCFRPYTFDARDLSYRSLDDEAERECGDRHDRAAIPHACRAVGS